MAIWLGSGFRVICVYDHLDQPKISRMEMNKILKPYTVTVFDWTVCDGEHGDHAAILPSPVMLGSGLTRVQHSSYIGSIA